MANPFAQSADWNTNKSFTKTPFLLNGVFIWKNAMNLFKEFSKIINTGGVQVATIYAKNGNMYTILTQNGQYANIASDGDYTGKVFVQQGRIIGQAPNLPYSEIEV